MHHADADGDVQLHFIIEGEDVAARRIAQALGDVVRLVAGDVGQHERELLAAHAAQHVGGAQVQGDELGELAQQLVARRVAVGVVHALEVVQIDHQHGGGAAFLPELLQPVRALFEEGAAAKHAGQRVVACGVVQLAQQLVAHGLEARHRQRSERQQRDAQAQRNRIDHVIGRIGDDAERGGIRLEQTHRKAQQRHRKQLVAQRTPDQRRHAEHQRAGPADQHRTGLAGNQREQRRDVDDVPLAEEFLPVGAANLLQRGGAQHDGQDQHAAHERAGEPHEESTDGGAAEQKRRGRKADDGFARRLHQTAAQQKQRRERAAQQHGVAIKTLEELKPRDDARQIGKRQPDGGGRAIAHQQRGEHESAGAPDPGAGIARQRRAAQDQTKHQRVGGPERCEKSHRTAQRSENAGHEDRNAQCRSRVRVRQRLRR